MPTASDKTSAKHIDYGLLILIAAILGFGIVIQFSASYATPTKIPYEIILKHLLWVVIGLTIMTILIRIDYHFWQKYAIPIMGLALILLLAVFVVSKVGATGARRHLLLGGSVQPSELAKLAIFIYIAAWLASKEDNLHQVTVGLLPFSVLLGVFLIAILFQPDISTSVLIAITAMAMLIIAGADLLQIGILLGVIGLVFTIAILQHDYALGRLTQFKEAFLTPWTSTNDQVRTGYEAIHTGGLFGKGLGNSIYKLPGSGLPLAHSDSVFAVIGEELGLLGALTIIALFLFLAYKGTRIALKAPDSFGRLLAFGITAWIVLQAFINIAVVTVTIPNTGIPLPFISYGGSSMVTTLAGIGILLNISKGDQARVSLNANTPIRRRNRRPRLSNSNRRRSA